ncbi:MAG: AAA family ATPase [Nitriliruptorales bacterium]|nr:AAA family ATPase [Nitriliruptorales bacterium]
MRIAVAGKGGVGKTTIAGTLARALAENGHQVLAMDADPNPNLALTLGVSREHYDDVVALPHGLLEHREVDGEKTVVLTRPIEDIVGAYGIEAPAGIQLIALGQPRSAGGG